MKSLFIAPAIPGESGNGLAMRMGVFLEALASLGPVELVIVPLFGAKQSDSSLCRRLGITPRLVDPDGRVDTHFALLSGLSDPQVRLQAFLDYGKPSLAAHLSVPVLNEIRELIKSGRFDFVHVTRSYLLPVINALPARDRPFLSVDIDEDDAETCRRMAALHRQRGETFRGHWLEAEGRAFERLFSDWLAKADLRFISTAAERDALAARFGVQAEICTNSIDLPKVARRNPVGNSLLFVGGFGYFPNLDGAEWLLRDILPILGERLGSTPRTELVGRNAPDRLKALAQKRGARIFEDVEDLAPVYERAGIAIVPLRAGGGSRIKLLEAAAYLVPIVATSAGAENSGMEHGEHLLIADTPTGIAQACHDIWGDPEAAARRAAAAREHVLANHSRPATISTLSRSFATHFEAATVH